MIGNAEIDLIISKANEFGYNPSDLEGFRATLENGLLGIEYTNDTSLTTFASYLAMKASEAQLHYHEPIGAHISNAISSGITQGSLNTIHVGGNKDIEGDTAQLMNRIIKFSTDHPEQHMTYIGHDHPNIVGIQLRDLLVPLSKNVSVRAVSIEPWMETSYRLFNQNDPDVYAWLTEQGSNRKLVVMDMPISLASMHKNNITADQIFRAVSGNKSVSVVSISPVRVNPIAGPHLLLRILSNAHKLKDKAREKLLVTQKETNRLKDNIEDLELMDNLNVASNTSELLSTAKENYQVLQTAVGKMDDNSISYLIFKDAKEKILDVWVGGVPDIYAKTEFYLPMSDYISHFSQAEDGYDAHINTDVFIKTCRTREDLFGAPTLPKGLMSRDTLNAKQQAERNIRFDGSPELLKHVARNDILIKRIIEDSVDKYRPTYQESEVQIELRYAISHVVGKLLSEKWEPSTITAFDDFSEYFVFESDVDYLRVAILGNLCLNELALRPVIIPYTRDSLIELLREYIPRLDELFINGYEDYLPEVIDRHDRNMYLAFLSRALDRYFHLREGDVQQAVDHLVFHMLRDHVINAASAHFEVKYEAYIARVDQILGEPSMTLDVQGTPVYLYNKMQETGNIREPELKGKVSKYTLNGSNMFGILMTAGVDARLVWSTMTGEMKEYYGLDIATAAMVGAFSEQLKSLDMIVNPDFIETFANVLTSSGVTFTLKGKSNIDEKGSALYAVNREYTDLERLVLTKTPTISDVFTRLIFSDGKEDLHNSSLSQAVSRERLIRKGVGLLEPDTEEISVVDYEDLDNTVVRPEYRAETIEHENLATIMDQEEYDYIL